jgi:hypothetical protein
MKKKLTFLLAFALISCASIDSKVARLSTSELKLRRQQIQYRLAATAGEWSSGGGPVRIGAPTLSQYTEQMRHEVGPGSPAVIGERNHLLEEKEAIERELLRRRHTGQR